MCEIASIKGHDGHTVLHKDSQPIDLAQRGLAVCHERALYPYAPAN